MPSRAKQQVCIAMWSGPRNLSTTLMRSFGARADTRCSDEPFYAAYLVRTGVVHPMREEVIAAHETDPGAVAQGLLPRRDRISVHYQKHMAHHMVPGLPRGWMGSARHVFLIRHPARVMASYLRKTGAVSLEAIGFPLQTELYAEAERLTGGRPTVVDSDALLRSPEVVLRRLCELLDLAWDPAMLGWASGPRPEDGVWGRHWYDAVWRSSGFGPPPGELPEVPAVHRPVLDAALQHYQQLAAFSL